ncbi:SCO family protein [Xanthobacter dioxanivorans]|uniref:SCO family protein n=1 Tax=Xanthobacter dioxanivorans TaxID=2528964 RepID=A0A974PT34_9HYPH|nr:SCO family protein [Xanthobacter dioxanivorans]QRG08763.1 SCO family protein [Xanthobacter dioxanivorans]
MSQRSRLIVLFSAFAAGALVLVTAVTMLMPAPVPKITSTGTAQVGGPFSLVDQDGAPVTQAILAGKPSLIFFGFTHCPDVCPTALFEMSEIFAALGPDANKVQAFFVTVDPERDTPSVMKSYLASFAPQLKGLTGTPEAVDAMKKEYRVYSRKVPLSGGDYTMDHTAVVYLMDKTGAFVAPFNSKRPPADAAAELKRYF